MPARWSTVGAGGCALLVTVAACGSPSSPPRQEVESDETIVAIQVEPSSLSLTALDDTARLTVFRRARNGRTFLDPSPQWSIEDASVADVDGSGVVRSLSNGSTRVQAVSGTFQAFAPVLVDQAADTVLLPPVTIAVAPDGVVRVEADVVDARGNPMETEPPIEWTIAVPSVAFIEGPGRIRGVAADTTTLVAEADGALGSAVVWVAQEGWPNEPDGFEPLSDQPWQALASEGWNHNRDASIVSDPTAPTGDSTVLEFFFPEGYEGGSAPGIEFINSREADAVFMGFWMKVDPNWTGHPTGSQKIAFIRNAGPWDTDPDANDNLFLLMDPVDGGSAADGPFQLAVANNGGGHSQLPDPIFPNAGSPQDAVIVPGQWHKVEWLADRSNGILRWWLDGTLIGDYPGVVFDGSSGFGELTLTPVWGGLGSTKPRDEFWRFDQTYVSVRR